MAGRGNGMSENTTSAVFSVDELWLLQSVIRHEMAQMEQWKAPPASPSLNDQVAEALLFCHENDLGEAALLLTRRDCLAIDFSVPQGAKSPAGVPIGKSVLLKSFRARTELEEAWSATREEPTVPSHEEIASQLEEWKAQPPAPEKPVTPIEQWQEKRRKRGRRSA